MWKGWYFTKLKLLAVIPKFRPAGAKPQWDFLTQTALEEEALVKKPHVELSTIIQFNCSVKWKVKLLKTFHYSLLYKQIGRSLWDHLTNEDY